jgi:hypothetical protein
MRIKPSLELKESEIEQTLTGISERESSMLPSMAATSQPSGEELQPATETEEPSSPDSPRTCHPKLLAQLSESLSSHKDMPDSYLNDSIFNIFHLQSIHLLFYNLNIQYSIFNI